MMNFCEPRQPDRTLEIRRRFSAEEHLLYLTIPFEVPEGVERMTISYAYASHSGETLDMESGQFTSRRRLNTIDLGLLGPGGEQIGTSGSDKNEIFISETVATPGYRAVALTPGTWQIIAGVYRVAAEGVEVSYRVRFEMKHRRLLFGDPHTHTVASDGILTLEGLARHARAHGLDFLAITDHNQPASKAAMPAVEGLTLIPGVEWTQYGGHANFLGVDLPYDGRFFANEPAGVLEKFASARERGATIVLNHIQDESVPFRYDFRTLPFDAVEVWNGPMRMSNLRGIGMWDEMLKAGMKVPAVGGSDYHADRFAQMLAGPCMGVYAESAGQSDILEAVRRGRSFICFQPNSAALDMRIGNVLMGGTTGWREGLELEVLLTGLVKGDVVKLISPSGSREVFEAPTDGGFSGRFAVTERGYVRLELWQSFQGILPALPALVSNPIWIG